MFLGERESGPPVALKVIRADVAADCGAILAQKLDESRLARQLTHPCIGALYDVAVEGHWLFTVEEHLPGATAFDVFSSGRLPVALATGVTRLVLAALEHAHTSRAPDGTALDWVHGHVHLGTVRIGTSGVVKLFDFGVADALGMITDSGPPPAVDQAAYRDLAPEQARGRPRTCATDLWAAAVLLSELLTGAPAYERWTKSCGCLEYELVKAIHDAAIAPPTVHVPDLPAPIVTFLARALHVDPARRPATARAMHEALAEAEGRAGLHFDPAALGTRARGGPALRA